MVGAMRRRPPKGHDPVADELVDRPVLGRDCTGHFLKIGGQLVEKVFRLQTLGLGRKILKVGKEYRQEPWLDAQSQRDSRANKLSDDIQRNEGGERSKRIA